MGGQLGLALLPLPGLDVVLLQLDGPLPAVHLVVQPARVTHRGALLQTPSNDRSIDYLLSI